MIKNTYGLIVASLVITFFIVIQTTVSNILWLKEMGLPTPFSLFIDNSFHDLSYMGALLLPLTLVGFLFCLLTIKFSLRYFGVERGLSYALSGFLYTALLIFILPLFIGGNDMISGARSEYGKMYILLIGLTGGYLFSILTKK